MTFDTIVAGLGALDGMAIVGSDDATRQLFADVVRPFWSGEIEFSALGPVVGTHAGPGAGGVVAITKV